MGNLTIALVIVLCINVLLFLGQSAMTNINPDGSKVFNCQGTILSRFDKNLCLNTSSYILDDTDPGSKLPGQSSSVNVETGNIFTDVWSAIKNFLLDEVGLGYLFDLLSGPSTLFKIMGAPGEVAFGLSALWYGITFFLIVDWLKGGSS